MSKSHAVTLHSLSQRPFCRNVSQHPGEHKGISHAKYAFCTPVWLTKSSGCTCEPRKTSSLKYRNESLSPGMLSRLHSMAGELNTGRWDLFSKMSACLTMLILGDSMLSHDGIWPSVTT
uniref:Uncharacterized protein n=1 Tax=Globisporangium ultimum (strain ATCC 200006 / CBS 805.95 / DAOM BR144) TaxID=431595 RepID=K3XAW2_GLOUD